MPATLDRATFIRPYAHRGLHNPSRNLVENTTGAFNAAIAKDYAIECDLRPIAGGVPIVFHDATLDRLIDGSGPIDVFTLQDMKQMKYKTSNDIVLSFAEFLELVDGRVPLMVELKSKWLGPDLDFLKQVTNLASRYHGPLVLKSFNPAVMAAVRQLAPAIPRGIVSGKYDKDGHRPVKFSVWRRFCLSNLLYSRSVRPSFISYRVKDLPTIATTTARHVFKLPLFTWTVRSTEDRARATKLADAPIFEGFEP